MHRPGKSCRARQETVERDSDIVGQGSGSSSTRPRLSKVGRYEGRGRLADVASRRPVRRSKAFLVARFRPGDQQHAMPAQEKGQAHTHSSTQEMDCRWGRERVEGGLGMSGEYHLIGEQQGHPSNHSSQDGRDEYCSVPNQAFGGFRLQPAGQGLSSGVDNGEAGGTLRTLAGVHRTMQAWTRCESTRRDKQH
ncbi:hypothetical protein GGTG_01083 [Gaeumannomyces tritici R3-111a-1]|uniref:Uncharacterized protein n=1 Tax=Gaeumannomyces tritici (strain R3-111a-1) TaxID=644352 RepID=J3NIK4_GAET3|nr:hypothetical protein GGTG_01083 [Gaeumannomyces tritici R3-111a-1]EJT81097.1 hypothetical protein GGTG_01083 [Gaeumannomyces tritici R3-111a-1]